MTDAAQHDLLDIFDHIAFELCEPELANRLLSKIRSKVKTLEEFPEPNNMISKPKYEFQKIRWCPIENYVLFYQVSDIVNHSYILRVLYKKRNWEHLLSPG
ncbi:type II toxin-antitoxin system RelE/ParE family toxin [Anaerocolumna sp. MB42-C2]|uniref:type II toxin-antitoxin system RelE/ParE family toxin n=1 Tax=Anaerocolumna sp. MB42-C2 TaxID=3070997 RepID=UPI0027DFC456|nr:type II toxin-antitoxin system RelE/ParE family toxin [Anaerocolumna sp. MB42-C2]WMJ90743.1 type II toxin-antitoxin system RelE/ParE family toxin [Anaerocolumna sp. MB42-C2]